MNIKFVIHCHRSLPSGNGKTLCNVLGLDIYKCGNKTKLNQNNTTIISCHFKS